MREWALEELLLDIILLAEAGYLIRYDFGTRARYLIVESRVCGIIHRQEAAEKARTLGLSYREAMKRHGRALQASHRLTDSIIAVVGLQHKQSGMRRCLQM